MKRVVALVSLATLLSLTGCVAGSHLEIGPVTVSSWVEAHEWRDADFFVRDGVVVGSTLGFFSSEASIAVGKAEGLSVGAAWRWGPKGTNATGDNSSSSSEEFGDE